MLPGEQIFTQTAYASPPLQSITVSASFHPPPSSPSRNKSSSNYQHSVTITEQMGAQVNHQPQQSLIEPTAENVEALLEAARYNDIDDIISLASAGIDLDSKDSQGRTALHMAAANGHVDIVEYLIKSEVDLNASNAEKNTPLHWACLNGHIEVVKKLILAGASVTALNSHEHTPMDEAVSRGKMDVINAVNTAVVQLELTGVNVS